jgi:hypothetical protein
VGSEPHAPLSTESQERESTNNKDRQCILHVNVF